MVIPSHPNQSRALGGAVRVTYCGLTACQVMRAMRLDGSFRRALLHRCDLVPPDPGPGRRRWSRGLLDPACVIPVLQSACEPIRVAVPYRASRIQGSFASNTVFGYPLPPNTFVSIDDGIAISGPELLFCEMGSTMRPEVLALLGYELCGTFARDPIHPRDGAVGHFLPPTTNTEQIAKLLGGVSFVHGIDGARTALTLVRDNAWSACEAIVSLMLCLPIERGGYGISNIHLNERRPADFELLAAGAATSRVPDIVLEDIPVDMNYDGEEHLDLRSVADAAIECGTHPESGQARERLDRAMSSARRRYVEDRRRDRELVVSGRTLLTVTKEDLYQRGGLDDVMRLAALAAERRYGRKLRELSDALHDTELTRMRQELLWSLLPGQRGRELSAKLARGC